MDFIPLDEAINAQGLRLVIVRGAPSPWGQAAKAFFDMKGVPYTLSSQAPGEANEDLVAWSGQASGPVVAWNDEKPLSNWLDILLLADRIAPQKPLLPADPAQRALMIGLSHELCGELGVGWNRRLMMFKPAMDSGSPPDAIKVMAQRYRYEAADAEAAEERIVAVLKCLTDLLASQKKAGNDFFFGDAVSALDIYWAAFSVLLSPYSEDRVPMPAKAAAGFAACGPVVEAALDQSLIDHRNAIFDSCFEAPMVL